MSEKKSFDLVIKEAREALVKTYNPVAIYRGHPERDSDLDVLVVVDTIKDRYLELVKGHRALIELSVPKDLLLLTKDEFETASERVSSLHYKIKRQGKKIYARA